MCAFIVNGTLIHLFMIVCYCTLQSTESQMMANVLFHYYHQEAELVGRMHYLVSYKCSERLHSCPDDFFGSLLVWYPHPAPPLTVVLLTILTCGLLQLGTHYVLSTQSTSRLRIYLPLISIHPASFCRGPDFKVQQSEPGNQKG